MTITESKTFTNRDRVIKAVQRELERQDTLWGDPLKQRQTPDKRLTILVEEVGEYAKEVCDHRPDEAYVELIQVAAVAIANAQKYLAGQYGETIG